LYQQISPASNLPLRANIMSGYSGSTGGGSAGGGGGGSGNLYGGGVISMEVARQW